MKRILLLFVLSAFIFCTINGHLWGVRSSRLLDRRNVTAIALTNLTQYREVKYEVRYWCLWTLDV